MEVTKKQLVLDISEAVDHAVSNIILFQYREEDTGFISHAVVLPRKGWNDLGCPNQITVTLVPGDQLNNKETV